MGGTDPTKRYMPPVLPESLIGDLLYGKVYLVADARLESANMALNLGTSGSTASLS